MQSVAFIMYENKMIMMMMMMMMITQKLLNRFS